MKQLSQLEKIWYDKLKQEGFEDIEDHSSPFKRLKRHHSHDFFRECRNSFKVGLFQAYYYQAKEFYLRHSFKNWLHREVWYLHSQGYTVRKIALELPELPKSTIQDIIQTLRVQINWKQK